MHLSDICTRYDERLRTADYADADASANGLQVGPAEADVERVAFAVDAAVETAERAVEWDADLLVTHHGLVWGALDDVTGQTYRRVAPLVENGVALYVSHLPLDGHPELGNAAGVADALSLDEREPFAEVAGEPVGLRGRREPVSAATLREVLEREVGPEQGVRSVEFGPEEIAEVAVVTGSGADFLGAAADAGVDALVTGEGKQKLYHEAREAGVTAFLAGHYATETFGVQSLRALAEEWGLTTTFLDCPTGL
jgi:dinuclear metal center YbgI/SA1388 family protein